MPVFCLGGGHEAARVRHTFWRRRCRVAAHGARAAARAHATHRRFVGSGRGRPGVKARVTAFLQGLQQLGWTVGRNVQIDIRWARGNAEQIRRHAADLVALAPDVILGPGTPALGPLLKQPVQSRLYSRSSSTRLAKDLSIAWRGRGVT